MIENDLQYDITKTALNKFRKALQEPKSGSQPEWVYNASIDAINSMIDDLEGQIAEYEATL